jgi:predicted nuclease of predicted toxin-antitoxin system
MAKKQKYHFDKKGLELLAYKIEEMILTKDKYFGNARAIRQLINDIITIQNLRISNTKESISPQSMNKIKRIDVEKALEKSNEKAITNRKIGFK